MLASSLPFFIVIHSYILSVHHPADQPVQLTVSSLDSLLTDRLSKPKAFQYLAECYARCQQLLGKRDDESMDDSGELSVEQRRSMLAEVQNILVRYAHLLLHHADLYQAERDGYSQLIQWLETLILSPSTLLSKSNASTSHYEISHADSIQYIRVPFLEQVVQSLSQRQLSEFAETLFEKVGVHKVHMDIWVRVCMYA